MTNELNGPRSKRENAICLAYDKTFILLIFMNVCSNL